MRFSPLFLFLLVGLLHPPVFSAEPADAGRTVVPKETYHGRDAAIDRLRGRLMPTNPKTFKALTYHDANGVSLPYRLFEPAQTWAGKKYPLVLVLHGAGSRGSDNLAHITGKHASITTGIWTLPENQKERPCYVLAPQCPPSPHAWIRNGEWGPGHRPLQAEPAPAMKAVVGLMEGLLEELPIDPDRIYVLGASMGGYGAWDLLARYPQRFAAAVPVCGGLADGQAARIAHVPVWIFHGNYDDVEPVSFSQRDFEELKRAGGKPRYTEFDKGDHGIALYAWTEPGLMEWLFAQKRRP